MILGYGVGDIFKKYRLTGLGRRHDKSALPLAYRREHIHNAGREIVGPPSRQIEFLLREQGRKGFERHTVTNKFGRTAVDTLHLVHREIFVIFTRSAYCCFHDIAGLQTISLDLLRSQIHIIRRGQIIVVARTQEAISFGHYFKQSGSLYQPVEAVRRFLTLLILIAVFLLVFLALLLLLLVLLPRLVELYGCCSCGHGGLCCGFLFLTLRARHEPPALRAREECAKSVALIVSHILTLTVIIAALLIGRLCRRLMLLRRRMIIGSRRCLRLIHRLFSLDYGRGFVHTLFRRLVAFFQL